VKSDITQFLQISLFQIFRNFTCCFSFCNWAGFLISQVSLMLWSYLFLDFVQFLIFFPFLDRIHYVQPKGVLCFVAWNNLPVCSEPFCILPFIPLRICYPILGCGFIYLHDRVKNQFLRGGPDDEEVEVCDMYNARIYYFLWRLVYTAEVITFCFQIKWSSVWINYEPVRTPEVGL
jgi:hypothetical protein